MPVQVCRGRELARPGSTRWSHVFATNRGRSTRLLGFIMLCGMGLTAAPASAAPADAADMQALMGMLSKGYSAANCTPVDVAGGRRASVKCGHNSDPAGPTDAYFTLYKDPDTMAADFSDDNSWDEPVTCPGLSEPSPTTWHYHGSDQDAGALFCGSFGGESAEVEWTSNASLLLGSASGPDIAPLYQWWRTDG
jgi:hypothetical protein